MGDLRRIPGIGPNIEADLNAIGIHTVADLRDRDPEELYRLDCEAKGFREDPCQLYVFRLAVYYAMTPSPDPSRLRWWYWKDQRFPEEDNPVE